MYRACDLEPENRDPQGRALREFPAWCLGFWRSQPNSSMLGDESDPASVSFDSANGFYPKFSPHELPRRASLQTDKPEIQCSSACWLLGMWNRSSGAMRIVPRPHLALLPSTPRRCTEG